MASTSTLLSENLRAWLSARGFFIVTAAALLPLVLTGAWAATHQADLAAQEPTWDPRTPTDGDGVNFTAQVTNAGSFAVGGFNATLSVGRIVERAGQVSFIPDATNTVNVAGLKPGESGSVTLTWTARAGIYLVLVDADSADVVGEKDEFNNQKPVAIEVGQKVPSADLAPRAPRNLTGNSSAAAVAEVEIVDIAWTPESPEPGNNLTFTVTVTNHGPAPLANASLSIRAGQAFNGNLFPSRQTTVPIADLAPGVVAEKTLEWPGVPAGAYWVEAYVNVTGADHDTDAANNHRAEPFVVEAHIPADFKFPEPPKRLTINAFYINILKFLDLTLLVPFIGLFYAAGVLSDDRDKGNLTYILTRPVPRWLIPPTKFAVSFLIAAVALTVGVLATYALLYGARHGDPAYLVAPLVMSLVALFVYGAFFILLGVLVDRPYLIGVAFVIGWETVAGNFVPWVKNLTISHWLLVVLNEWDPTKPLPWPPESKAAVEALRNLLVVALVFLVAASVVMKRREFDL